MRIRRWSAAVATLATVVGTLGAAQAAAAKSVNIAFFSYNTTPYPESGYKAAQAEAKKLGATVTFFQSNNDPSTQASQMRDAMTSGKYQAFYIWPNNGVALQPLVKQAAKAGIKVAAADNTLGNTTEEAVLKNEPGLAITVGAGLKEQSIIGAQEIEKACAAQVGKGKPCSVAIQPGMSDFPPDVYRIGVLEPLLKKAGNISVSLMPAGDYSTPGGQQSTLTYFQAHKANVLYSYADQMVSGDLTALKQLKITPGKDLKIIGFGASNEALAGIKAGTWFASEAQYPETESRLAVKYLVAAVNGKKIPTVVDYYKLPGALQVIDKTVLKSHPGFKPDWDDAG